MFVSKGWWWRWCGGHCERNRPKTTPNSCLRARGGGGWWCGHLPEWNKQRTTHTLCLQARGGGSGEVAVLLSETNRETPPPHVCEWEGVVVVMWQPLWEKQMKNHPPTCIHEWEGVVVVTWWCSWVKQTENYPHLVLVSEGWWWRWHCSHCKRNRPRTTPTSCLQVRGGGSHDVAVLLSEINPETPPTCVCKWEGVVAMMPQPLSTRGGCCWWEGAIIVIQRCWLSPRGVEAESGGGKSVRIVDVDQQSQHMTWWSDLRYSTN